eukprot:TRINITY_DN12349_c1_g1_i3.p1 TRINITY_DN12349_c1_g1~~TRINITY_DN12349_c1_g1_i3.p1  ORF type:complete len:197 (-),score=68.22 TRINITY_DN12349_c1_g1_i3:200-790(-)
MAANRLSTSDSLRTNDIWSKSIGLDPHAGPGDAAPVTSIPEGTEINSSAKGLFRLAQLTGNSSTIAPGSCKRCGQVGHLYFQCRNTFTLNPKVNQPVEEEDDDDDPASDAVATSEDDSDDEDSDDEDAGSDDNDDSDAESDSDADSSSSGKKKKKKKDKKKKKASKKDKKNKKKKKEKKKDKKKDKEKKKKKKRKK